MVKQFIGDNMESKIKKIVNKFLDVELYSIAEYKGKWEIILKDRFDKGQCFLSDVEAIRGELEEFAYGGVSIDEMEDDDKVLITFQDIDKVNLADWERKTIKKLNKEKANWSKIARLVFNEE